MHATNGYVYKINQEYNGKRYGKLARMLSNAHYKMYFLENRYFVIFINTQSWRIIDSFSLRRTHDSAALLGRAVLDSETEWQAL